MAKYKQGWYNIISIEKFIKPHDNYMNSYKNGNVFYRSGWELKFMQYCDRNPIIKFWSTEPFPIPYFDPTQNKMRRYFIDGWIEFDSGDKFLVEIKPSKETIPPKVPKNQTSKAMYNYQKACCTFATNSAKWDAAKRFAAEKGVKFIIITEKHLGI